MYTVGYPPGAHDIVCAVATQGSCELRSDNTYSKT